MGHPKADECRKNAEVCEDLAKQAKDEPVARGFQKLAQEWRALATQIETFRF
jgi:hypothetical protein